MSTVGHSPSGQLPTAVTSPAEHTATARRRLRGLWIYTLITLWFFVLTYGLFVAVSGIELLIRDGNPVLYWTMHVLNLLATLVIGYLCLALKPGFGAKIRLRTVLWCSLPAVAMMVLSVVVPELGLWTHTPLLLLASLLLCFLPAGWRRRAIYAFVATVLIYAVLGRDTEDYGLFLYLLFLPVIIIASVWMWDLYLRTAQASTLAAQLASTSERLRIAADLHDIQGHNLQVIALEAELADRLLERDPAAAQQHIRRVRELVRATQQETTSVITGLRASDLGTELRNAVEVLSAAGMNVQADTEPLLASGTSAQLFSTVLRETSTNILRHSDAKNVSMSWRLEKGEVMLTIRNDGLLTETRHESSVGGGTGLASLRERFTQAGGTLTYGQQGNEFVLNATLPSRSEGAQT